MFLALPLGRLLTRDELERVWRLLLPWEETR